MTAALDPWLLDRLVCPATRTRLRYDEAAAELVSDEAGLAYPVREGVPVLLVEAARRVTNSSPERSSGLDCPRQSKIVPGARSTSNCGAPKA